MIEPNRRGMLTLVAIAVMALPGIAGATPILHVAPQWPGGALNGTEAARNARHDAHANERSSNTSDSDLGESEDLGFDGLGISTPPLTTPGQWLGGTGSDVSVLPSLGEPADLPNLLADQTLLGNGLTGPDTSALVNDLNPAAPAVVPEPGSLLLLGSGVVSLIARTRRRVR